MKALYFVCFCLLTLVGKAGVVSEVQCFGNKKTKKHILLRELTFHVGDTIVPDNYDREIKQSQNNLLNTSLFNFATIELCDSMGFTKAKITVTERWYIWPEVIVKFQERNFTEWLKERNLTRIDYGLYITHKNFRGRQEKLQLQAKYGFNKKLGVLYEIPYLTKSLKAGLIIAAAYNTQNEVFTGLDSLNKMIYTKNKEAILQETISFHAEYTRRENLYFRHFVMADYIDIRSKNELNLLKDEYLAGQDELRFVSLAYMFKNDHRDSKNYPLQGYYADLELKQSGIGLNESGLNLTRVTSNFRLYRNIKPSWYYAIGFYGQGYSDNDIPFYLQNGLGFNRYVRSYEPYVIFGQFSGLGKALIKYQLIKPKIHTLPVIKAEKFNKIHYAVFSNLFVDVGYVHNKVSSLNRLNNELLLGAGFGLDFVTFYDLVWRAEYSINKYKEHGLYISFVAPI